MPTTTKKRINAKSKGNTFERAICKQLSLWWSDNERDDVFWRSSSSGSRATQRSRQGKKTANSAGDIAAMDADAQELLKIFTFELKVGYSNLDALSLIDQNSSSLLLDWFEQAEASRQSAGCFYWCLIWKKDRRTPVMMFPCEFLVFIKEHLTCPIQTILMPEHHVVIIPLAAFFESISPSMVKDILRECHSSFDKSIR